LHEGVPIEPFPGIADVAEDGVIANLIGALRIGRRVQHRAAPGYCEGRTGEPGNRAVQLPVAQNRLRDALVASVALPWQRIREAELEVVPPVETSRRPVAPELAGRIPGQRRTAISIGAIVHGLAEGVRTLEHEALREGLVEGHLQRLVLGRQPRAPGVDRLDAPEGEVRTAGVTAAEGQRRVDVEAG